LLEEVDREGYYDEKAFRRKIRKSKKIEWIENS